MTHPRATSGFTLVEVLVTLFVVAALTSLVVIQLTPDRLDRGLEERGTRLGAIIELARERSRNSGDLWGIALTRESLAFVRHDRGAGRWVPVEDAPFARIELDPDTHLEADVEGRLQGMRNGASGLRRISGLVPNILILPDGEMSAMRLSLRQRGAERAFVLESDGFSVVRDASQPAPASPEWPL